jgi:hypothetical protein
MHHNQLTISMNQNKYSRCCKFLGQKWWWTIKNWNSSQAMKQKCTQEFASKIFPRLAPQFVPYPLSNFFSYIIDN